MLRLWGVCNSGNQGYCWNILIVATVGTETIVGTHCYSGENQDHCWNTLLQQWKPTALLDYSDLGSYYRNSDLGYNCCICYFFPFRVKKAADPLSRGSQRSNLLTSPHMTWLEERLWDFCILQRVHLSSNLFFFFHVVLSQNSSAAMPYHPMHEIQLSLATNSHT
jgi:hypothetical protein